MPYADLGKYKFHYQEFGVENKSKGTICFLHAFTLDHRMWQNQAKYFSKKHHVIVPDLKGHGLSDAPISGYTRAERADDIVKLLDVLSLNSVHMVGISYGGTTVMGIALNNPERLDSLTLIGTAVAGYKISSRMSKLDKIAKENGIEAAKKKWISSSLIWYQNEKSELREFIKTMMVEHSGAIWRDPMRGNYPIVDDISKVGGISLPILIMVGEEDKMFLSLAEKLHKLIKSSELYIIPNIGHLVNLEAPDLFNETVESFINSIS
jgi:pimeloyl-ACP methyl ester carboxylesterase